MSRAVLLAVLLVSLACSAQPALGDSSGAGDQIDAPSSADSSRRRLNFLVLGIPLSPLHNVVAIGQELCLRGHNVTVGSLGTEGLKKVGKYSPKCKVNYVNLGPMPLTKEEMDDIMTSKVGSTNSSIGQMKAAATHVFSKFWGSMDESLEVLLAGGTIKPDFALISMPLGSLGHLLNEYGVDYAVNVPTNLIPPVSDAVAPWVPPLIAPMSIRDMSFLSRLQVIGFNTALNFGKRIASAAGIIPASASDFNPASLKGKLLLVNSIPGLDYPQPLPPLIQYTGPVIDVQKVEEFPPEVEAWLDSVPEGKPVVYVSYGTVAVIRPDHAQHMLNGVFAGDDFYVLWALPKSQQEGLPESKDLPSNVMIHHWIPTTRALAHPKVKAFVSHCGGNSLSESMALGVPVVGYPQFGDQIPNCQRMADAKAGITAPVRQSWVRKEDITEVLSNQLYAERAQSLGRLFKTFGGAEKAANLLEAAAAGDLKLMTPPTDESFQAWFLLNGYDLLILGSCACSFAMFGALACLKGMLTQDNRKGSTKVKKL